MNVDKAKSKKSRKKKIPGAPKKPLNPYMEFVKAERPKVKEEMGNVSLMEVAKELGRRWKNLSSAEKNCL